MGVTQGTISDILKQARWTGSPNQRPLGYHQRISTPLEDLYMLRVMRAKRSLLSPRLRAQIIRRTVCRLSKRTIGVFLLQDSILAGWHDARLIEVYRRRRQWVRRHHFLDICHWRHCIFNDESAFKLHHRWTSPGA